MRKGETPRGKKRSKTRGLSGRVLLQTGLWQGAGVRGRGAGRGDKKKLLPQRVKRAAVDEV